jgi:membrane-associated phospholipid phosphatase
MIFQEVSIYLNSFLHKSLFFDYLVYFFANVLPFAMIIFAVIYVVFYNTEKSILAKKPEPLGLLKGLWLCFFVVFSWGASLLLKMIFGGDRPFVSVPQIMPLFSVITNGSFPSGHSFVLAALSTFIFFKSKKLGYIFLSLTLLVGLARVVAGVHFVIDIIAGYILGAIFAFLVQKFVKN